MASRLKEHDWQTIIEEGIPWTDDTFPPGPHALFINHLEP